MFDPAFFVSGKVYVWKKRGTALHEGILSFVGDTSHFQTADWRD